MDFDDTREEAAFRAEARAWLAANAEEKNSGFETWQSRYPGREGWDGLERAQAFQKKKAEAGFAGIALAHRVGRARAAADLPGDLRPGGVAPSRAARLLRDRPRHVHADALRLRDGGAEAALRARGAPGRRGVVPALLGARRRLRPGGAAHAGDPRRRPLGHQRSEDLDVGRALGRLGDPRRPQRPEGAEAQGAHVLLLVDEIARHRDPAHQADLGRVALQRGVLHRRAHSRQPAARRGRRRLGSGHHDLDERAA